MRTCGSITLQSEEKAKRVQARVKEKEEDTNIYVPEMKHDWVAQSTPAAQKHGQAA